MKKETLVPIRFFCGLISIYHIIEGIAATISGEFAARIAVIGYGASLEMITPVTPLLEVLFRFLGAFALTFGVMMGFAAVNPRRNEAVIYGGMVFFAVRLIDRLVFANLLLDGLGITATRNYRSIFFIALMLVGLLIFKPKKQTTVPAP